MGNIVPSAVFVRRHIETILFLAVYASIFTAWNLAGGSFRVWPDLWQLLPWPPLVEDLGGSLLDLHSQPPLLNLLFGWVLKVSARTGATVESLLQPVYFAIGAVTVAAFSGVAARIVPRPWIRRAVLLLFLLNPYFYAALHYLFYTAWELLYLTLAAFFSLRYFERPGAKRFAAAIAPAVLLLYTRSLFHPIWFIAFLALLAAPGRPTYPADFRSIAVVAAVGLLLVLAWPLKNLVRFGFFGFSSWSGLSIARGLPTGDPLLPTGYPDRLAAFARYGSQPVDPSAAYAARGLVPPVFRGSPTLDTLAKPDGAPNWNHYAIIPISRQLGAAAVERLRQEPSLLFYKALDFYLNGYAIYEARWPYQRGFAPELTTGDAWAGVYEVVVYQRFRAYEPDRTRVTTGFAIWFPFVLVAAVIVLVRRRPWGPEERTVVVLLFTILWVLALVLFVDGPEGNRVRFSTSPFLSLLVGWLISVPPESPGRKGIPPA